MRLANSWWALGQMCFVVWLNLCCSLAPKVMGPQFKPVYGIPEKRAVVYFYRIPQGFGNPPDPDSPLNPYFPEGRGNCVLRIDGKKLGDLREGGYFGFYSTTGSFDISADPRTSPSSRAFVRHLDIREGETYYIRCVTRGGFGLVVNSPRIGGEEIGNCHLQEADEDLPRSVQAIR